MRSAARLSHPNIVTAYDAKTGKLDALNSSGPAPSEMSIRKLKSLGMYSMPRDGIHSVTVPGCVAGWAGFGGVGVAGRNIG